MSVRVLTLDNDPYSIDTQIHHFDTYLITETK